MPLLVQRTYRLDVAGTTGTDPPNIPFGAAPAVVSGSQESLMSTRTCHRWSFVDAARHETCLVTLQAHQNLHVDVTGEGGADATAPSPSPSPSPSPPPPPERHSRPVGGDAGGLGRDADGLCGFTWEFTLVQTPHPPPGDDGGSAADETTTPPPPPIRARFYFAHTTPLALATLHGTGGVVFLNSRHVLVATEAAAAAGAMDSFVLGSDESAAWTRLAAAVVLPCPRPPPPPPPTHAHRAVSRPSCAPAAWATLLLVAGVPLTNSQTRLVYVIATPCSSSSSSRGRGSAAGDDARAQPRAWDVLACVADLIHCADSAAAPPALEVLLRHVSTLPMLRLGVDDAVGVDDTYRSRSSSSRPPPSRLVSPADLLWAFVEDVAVAGDTAVRVHRDKQVCGSLVALLPCSPASSGALRAAPLPLSSPPAVLAMGVTAAAPYGVLGVCGAALDSYASTARTASLSSVHDIMEELLPSPERTVYELVVGRPTTCVCPCSTTSTATTPAAADDGAHAARVSAQTSLLLLLSDGIVTNRNSRSSGTSAASTPPPGLYLTDATGWDVLAVQSRSHRVPPASTLWCALDPVVLSPPALSAAVDGGVDGGGAGWTARSRDPLHWGLADLDRWMRWCSEEADGSGGAVAGPRSRWWGPPPATTSLVSSSPSSPALEAVAVTAVASRACVPATARRRTAVRCLPLLDTITQELTLVWGCVGGDGADDEAAEALAVARAPPSPSSGSQAAWEAQVAEWVAATYIREALHTTAPLGDDSEDDDHDNRSGSSSSGGEDEATAAAAATATYRAMRMLWAHAVLHARHGGQLPRWPRVLLEVVRGTTSDAMRHHAHLHAYARAVQSFTMARLATDGNGDADALAAEVEDMRRSAGVFARLLLHVLAELDWCAGDAPGRACSRWMILWFIGCGGAPVSRGAAGAAGGGRSGEEVTAAAAAAASAVAAAEAAVVEGLAMQVLLWLGAAAAESPSPTPTELSPLQWLRRALLLFACRDARLPLELTVEDVIAASGVSLQPGTVAARQEAAQAADGVASAHSGTDVAMPSSREAAELRESMEDALLRLVASEALYGAVCHLSNTSPAAEAAAATTAGDGAEHLVLRGVLSIADLHALLCDGWRREQPRDTAAPAGALFVCCLVDLAMAATATDAPAGGGGAAAAAAYNAVVTAALDRWGVQDGARDAPTSPTSRTAASVAALARLHPVIDATAAAAAAAAAPPFPFATLPPLLTIYLWYHVVRRLCTAPSAQVLDAADATSAATAAAAAPASQQQAWVPWLRRAAPCGGVPLQELYQGVCVLRCLAQEDVVCAEEIFAAMHLVHSGADQPASRARASAADVGWLAQYVAAWRHLLLLDAPPLCRATALAAYQERCGPPAAATEAASCEALLRVLHLVYASAGSGRVLRLQLSRTLRWHGGDVAAAAEAGPASYAAFTRVLAAWRWGAVGHTCATTNTNASATTAANGRDVAATLSSWLVQVWANVLVCDPEAVTDVGVYEHLFTALAHAKQQQQRSAAAAGAAADVAFALLRPCLLYALPLLQRLAVEEELLNSGDSAAHVGNGGLRSPAPHPPRVVYAQHNTALLWRGGSDGGAVPHARAPERLCAGEVCERARRQVRRLVSLFAAAAATDVPDGDIRFTALAQLLAMQPSTAELAEAQRRHTQHRRSGCSATAPVCETGAAAAAAAVERRSPSSSSTADDDDDGEGSSSVSHGDSATATATEDEDEDAEPMPELAAFALSPAAAYVAASTAEAVHHAGAGGASGPQTTGCLVVLCEVLRRELRAFTVAELRGSGCVEADAAPLEPHHPRWRLVADAVRLKAFVNAVAEAVEPLSSALALAQPLSMPLLLVLEVLHTVVVSEADVQHGACVGSGTDAAGQSPVLPSAERISAEAAVVQLLHQWIRVVATPLYQRMAPEDRSAVRQLLTEEFGSAYLEAPPANNTVPAALSTARHRNSDLHGEWTRWRQEQRRVAGGGRGGGRGGTTAAALECVRACVAPEYRSLLLLPAAAAAGRDGQPPAPTATPPPPSSLHHRSGTVSSTASAAAAVGSAWMDAGSALRSSLLHTIGATVAPRAAPSPQPQSPSSAPARALPAVTSPPVHEAVALHQSVADATQLLVKEESFKRRQRADQLLREWHDLVSSPAFGRALTQLYVAMRVERRRRELTAFALDQHDLIFAFAHREHQLLLDTARAELRRAWCEWCDQQRFAVRRLLQEERDARMAVQATAHATRASLADTASREGRVWVLHDEGRAGLAALEEDARDALAVAAARAHVVLTTRAAEAEEEAAAAAAAAAMTSVQRRGRKGLGGGAAAVVVPLQSSARHSADGGETHQRSAAAAAAVSSSSAAANSVSAPTGATQPLRPPKEEAAAAAAAAAAARPVAVAAERHDVSAAPAAVSGASGLLGALSRWQTALRDTVAPPPPAGRGATAKEAGGATAAAPVAAAATMQDDWGWSSASGEDDPPPPAAPPAAAPQTVAEEPRAAPTVQLPSHPIGPPRRTAPAAAAAVVIAAAETTAPPPTQPPRRKRLGAAVILEPPVSSSASPPQQQQQQRRQSVSVPEDASTPDPVRSILPAVEAAAMESASKSAAVPRRESRQATTSVATPRARSSETGSVASVAAAAAAATPTNTAPINPDGGAAAAAVVGGAVADDDGWGWSDEEDVVAAPALSAVSGPAVTEPRAAAPPVTAVTAADDDDDDGWGWSDDDDSAAGDVDAGATTASKLVSALTTAAPPHAADAAVGCAHAASNKDAGLVDSATTAAAATAAAAAALRVTAALQAEAEALYSAELKVRARLTALL
ncbi:hypothetical protein NESM_000579400 [Novymonas esmeraldas]|uniref:Uncharacterized protein n=1 Tax=Novymonas esmeraldas TaxID=1808958 RepID=A0AAW0ETE0_9TRYP